MFASLRHIFSSYQTCSLHFNIEENIIIEALALLRFDTAAITATEACAAPGGVYPIEA
jgi:hypothetical protein